MSLSHLQSTIWGGRLPLEIRLDPSESTVFDQTDAYMVRSIALVQHPSLAFVHLLYTLGVFRDSKKDGKVQCSSL